MHPARVAIASTLLTLGCAVDATTGEQAVAMGVIDPRAAHPSGLVLDAEGRLDLPADPKWLPGWSVRWTQPWAADASCVVDGRLLSIEPGSRGVRAVDAATGAELWSLPAADDDPVYACQPLSGSLALLERGDHVAVIDARDGREAWRRKSPDFLATVGGAPPRVLLRACHQTDGVLRCELEAIAPDGQQLWHHQGAPGEWPVVATAVEGGAIASATGWALIDPSDGRVLQRAEGAPPDTWLDTIALAVDGSGRHRVLSGRPLGASSGAWSRSFGWMSPVLPAARGAGLLLADDALRLIELSSGRDRWTIPLAADLALELHREHEPRVIALDARRVVVAYPHVTPMGIALVIDLEDGALSSAHLGGHLEHAWGELLLSAGGAVAYDEDAAPIRAYESLQQDLEHNLLVIRERLQEEHADPTTGGLWWPTDAEEWLGILLASDPQVEARVMELLHDTYGEAPTDRVASQRWSALSILAARFPQHEAAQLADETIAWALELRGAQPDACDGEGACRMYQLTESEQQAYGATREAHGVLSAYVTDPAPLDALEATTFGAGATPPGSCGEPRTDAERAALALARSDAFPMAAVSATWCERGFVRHPRWRAETDEHWPWPVGQLGPPGDPEWHDAPAILVGPRGAGCFPGPAHALIEVRGRFRAVAY